MRGATICEVPQYARRHNMRGATICEAPQYARCHNMRGATICEVPQYARRHNMRGATVCEAPQYALARELDLQPKVIAVTRMQNNTIECRNAQQWTGIGQGSGSRVSAYSAVTHLVARLQGKSIFLVGTTRDDARLEIADVGVIRVYKTSCHSVSFSVRPPYSPLDHKGHSAAAKVCKPPQDLARSPP